MIKIIKEFLFGIIEFVFSNIESKFGFAFFFLTIGIVFLIPDQEKPFLLYF